MKKYPINLNYDLYKSLFLFPFALSVFCLQKMYRRVNRKVIQKKVLIFYTLRYILLRYAPQNTQGERNRIHGVRFGLIIFFLMLVQLQTICMEQERDIDIGKSWIHISSDIPSDDVLPQPDLLPRYQRPQPPLPIDRPGTPQPKIPDETIKNFYNGIEYDNTAILQNIISNYPAIVHVYANYSSLTHNFVQATPMYVASYLKKPSAVRLLLKSRADVNKGTATGDSPLHKVGSKRIAKILVEEGHAAVDYKNNDGFTPVHEALSSYNKRLDVAHYLLKHGAKINQVRGEDGNTLLHEAVSCFQADDAITETAFLLERGANPFLRNAQEKTAYELIHHNFRLMKLFYSPKDRKAQTFDFFVSVLQQEEDISIFEKTIDLLLDYEPDFSGADEYGNTLLHKAIFGRKPNSIKFLVRHNVLPLTTNKYENTVLDLVYVLQAENCVKALSEAVFEKFFVTPCYSPGYKVLKAFLKYAFKSIYKETFVRGILHCAASPKPEIAYDQCLLLLKWGAPVNLKSQKGDFPKQDDKYPYALSGAVAKWDVNLIDLFLDYGATVHKEMLEQECCYDNKRVQDVRERLKKSYDNQRGYLFNIDYIVHSMPCVTQDDIDHFFD